MITKNFLSKIRGLFSASESTDVSLDCRSTVVRPSFDRRSSLLKLVSVLVLVLTIGSGNAWGAVKTGWTRVTQVSEITSGGTFIFGYEATANSNVIVPMTIKVTSTTSGNGYAYSGTKTTSNTTTIDMGNNSTVTTDYEYSVVTGSASGKVCIVVMDGTYKNYYFSFSGTSNGNMRVANTKSNYTDFTPAIGSNDVVSFTNVQYNTRGLRYNNGSPRFTNYGSAAQLGFVMYKKASSCDKSVGVTKGSESHGEVTTIGSASVATCSGTASDRRVTITVTPDDCYDAPSTLTWTKSSGTVSASKQSGPTDNGDGTFSYVYQFAQNDNGAGTFGVTCTAKAAGYTVNFDAGPGVSASSSLTETCSGSGVTLPAVTATGVCKGWTTFAGWATAPVTDSTTTSGVTLYAAGDNFVPASNGQTLYAVYSKSKGGGGFKLSLVASSTTYYVGQKGSGNYLSAETSSANAAIFTYENGYLYYDDSGTKKYISITGNNTNLYVTTDKPAVTWTESGTTTFSYLTSAATRYLAYNGSANPVRFASYNNNSSYPQYFTKHSTATTYYCSDPNCCTQLGTINGSVNLTTDGCGAGELKATWKMLATTGIASQTLRVYDENLEEVTAKRITGITASTSNQTKTISGLNPCKEYYVTVENVSSGGEYCAPGDPWESDVVTTLGYTLSVTKSNCSITSGSEPARICNNVSVTYAAATGYALPTSITVTNAGVQNSGWTWNSGTGVLTINKANVTGNVAVTITPTCVPPVVAGDPADASYYVGDAPTALSVTATLASGTRTYLWKVSTDNGDSWSNAAGTNNLATYSGASLTTASAGTIKFKCIVGNSQGGCTVESAVATITVSNASYFPNGKTIFIQAESTSAWTGGGCVKAWFHTAGGSETAQSTYWLFDATGGDAGKKLFATVVPASGNLPYLDIQRFAANCSDWWNKNGGCSYSDASGSNTIRSTGKHDDSSDGDYIRWNVSGVTIDLHGDPSGDEWASSLASFSDQGAGVWTATYNNYAPADAGGESQDFKAKTNYNGWIGNTGSNNNATLDGMHVGSTYNITATLNVTTHSLVMSKTFVKGTVHYDLQGHGDAIADVTNVTAGSKISAPSAPSATGYTFGGWYKEPACTNAWNFASDVVNETMTLYAKWTANVYTITKTLTNVSNTGLPASFTYTGAATTALNSTFTVNTTNFFLPSSITVTMGGTPLTAGSDYTYNNSTGAFTFSRIISGNIVITASATAKLKSIAITTQPTTRKYFAGESFSSAGAVVTATMGDGSTKAVTASTTWTPPATPLAAGTGLTVTASYTENAINMTATTTIDVYSVTVNKVNEDGDAVSADGVTATWTVGTKALAASATSASKYVFKQWEVTGASIGSTSSANTTLSNPTANVVVNAVFWKPRTVKWSVNGNDSYNTGSPTTTVAYNGTISTVPSDPSGLACASTFIAWTDAEHNNGTTAKASASYYGAALYTAAGDFPNITAETTTFYAVFAEGGGAAVNTVMWSEDWTGVTSAKKPSQYDGTGRFVYNSGTVTYTESGSNCNVKAESYAGGSSPELYIKGGEWWNIANIPTGGAATLTLTYMSNNDADVTTTTANVAVGSTSSSGNTRTRTITISGAVNNFDLKFAKSSNTRVDNVSVKVATVSLTNYVTECDANIVKVTYDANGGATSCTNTTTDKTEDFTVCSSAPTRDYYTFAGWLCSADSKTYAASATIDDAVIDADFTLTAQWTPVPYTITYNYNGGSAQVSPTPATSFTVESSDITLQTPTKGHDRFEGWYENADLTTGGVKTTIPAGSHENKTYYAKWATRHEIIFDADGTKTTIYRAEDEALNASIAGQGSIPVNPSAPSACSSKVFVGWIAEEIEDETDDEPTFVDLSSTVNANKHYYAVWATSVGNAIAAVEDATFTGGEYESYFSKTYGLKANDKYVYKNSIWTSSDMTAGTKVRIKVKHLSNSSAATLTIALINSSGTVVTSTTLTTTANSSDISNAAYSSNVELTATTAVTGYKITLSNKGSSSGVVILAATREVVATRSAYSTSCCATNVTLSQNSPENGTIAFGKTKVGTCGDQNVSLTITPEAGYQLHSYEVATGSGKVATKSVSPDIALDNNSSAVQNITLTFADEANGAYDVTASFSLMTVTSWTWTMHDGGGAIPDPLNLYVGQSARLDVAYTPAGVDASKKTYTRNKDNAYINWVGSAYAGYSTISGRATTGENTTAVTFTHADGPTKTVNVKVLPLPLTHFVDLVHGKAFADVAATIVDNALSATKSTPTSDDWVTPNANDCESGHLHLVGWIREDWPALVAYLNGTGDAPTTTAIVGAGNDGSGHAYFFAPNASINVQTFNGVTFYAVWSKVE